MDGGLLEEIVAAPDRDDLPDGRGVVSVSDQDEAGFLAEVAERQLDRIALLRRGIDHGEWAELDTAGLAPEAHFGEGGIDAWRQRWADARPIVLRGQADDQLPALGPLLAERARLGRSLIHGRADRPLDRLLDAGLERLDPRFDPISPEEANRIEAGGDPERDLDRRFLAFSGAPDFWIKSQRLSTARGDESARIRCSFGVETDDDASHDEARQRIVAAMARAVLPETEILRGDEGLLELLEELDAPADAELAETEPDSDDADGDADANPDSEAPPLDGELFLTQDIAFWNAPNGGALMHHDAFDEDYDQRQRAVVYVQLTGATAWIALSTQELAARVTELAELVSEGELPWLKQSLFRGDPGRSLLKKILKGGRFVYGELEKPGCGRLGRIVNHGPEFTSLLADAGHGFIMRPGDVLVLPNHGLGHTAMHSVWCASENPAYSLSLALRRGSAPA